MAKLGQLNWRQTFVIYIDALESGNQHSQDAAAAELMVIADYMNRLGISYPDIIPETTAQEV